MDIKHAHPIDRFFARNTASVVAVETFWGLALPLVVESTFLQLYLRSIGASATVIGRSAAESRKTERKTRIGHSARGFAGPIVSGAGQAVAIAIATRARQPTMARVGRGA